MEQLSSATHAGDARRRIGRDLRCGLCLLAMAYAGCGSGAANNAGTGQTPTGASASANATNATSTAGTGVMTTAATAASNVATSGAAAAHAAASAGRAATVMPSRGATAGAPADVSGAGQAASSAGASPQKPSAGVDAGVAADSGSPSEPAAACDPANKQPDAAAVAYTEQGSPPTGPFEVVIETEPSLKGFTIYRPADLTQRATFPVIAWENGGCILDGLLFAEFLREISSYGIVTIVDGVPNGSGMGALDVDGKTLMQAMDWAEQQNGEPCSKYYRKLEPKNIAAMGQSCGGLHAYAVAGDPRVSTVVIWNSGLLNADQSVLDKLHAPMAYFIGGMNDVSYPNADRDFKAITQPIPIFYGNLSVGHLATYSEDNGGEFGRVGAAWLRWQLLHDEGADAKGMFVGPDCGLCKTDWVILKKNMD